MADILDVSIIELADYSETGWRAYIGKNVATPDRHVVLEKLVNTETAQSITALKTLDNGKLAMKGTSTGITTISTANTSATDYTATLQAKTGTLALLTDAQIYIPTTEPAISTVTITLDCNNSQEAMFEPRLSVGTLTINTNFTIALANTTGTKLISMVVQLTGTIIITLPADFNVSIPSSIGTWDNVANTLTLVAGTDDIIEFQILKYTSSSKWILKTSEVAT